MVKTILILIFILSAYVYGADLEYEKLRLKKDMKLFKEKKWQLDSEYFYDTGAAFALALIFDKGIRNTVKSVENGIFDAYSDFLTPFGGIKGAGGVLIGTYAYAKIKDDYRMLNTSYTAMESVLAAGSVTACGKFIFGRSRPQRGNGNFDFAMFGGLNGKDSLPSGHSSIAWALFTPFAEEYSKWLYGIPLSVSFLRVYKDRHWTSDVIAGSAIGFLSGYTLYQWHNEDIKIKGNGIEIRF